MSLSSPDDDRFTAGARARYRKRLFLMLLGVVVGVFALCVIGIMFLFFGPSGSSYPVGPSPDERAFIAARFVTNRPVLERIVELTTSDSGPRGEVTVDSLVAMMSLLSSPYGRHVLYSPESWGNGPAPVYIAVWRRRGGGFDAPWWYAGYVHVPKGVDVSGSRRGRYKHIVDEWWLFSLDDPEGREGPKRKPSRAAKIEW